MWFVVFSQWRLSNIHGPNTGQHANPDLTGRTIELMSMTYRGLNPIQISLRTRLFVSW